MRNIMMEGSRAQDKKENIKRLICGLLIAFKNMIEFDKLQSLEEVNRKLNNC